METHSTTLNTQPGQRIDVPLGPRQSGQGVVRPLAEPLAVESKSSSLIAWTVRVAQAADRLMTGSLTGGDTAVAAGSLVRKTLNGLDRCCRLSPAHQDAVTVERVRLMLQEVLASRRDRQRRFEQLRVGMNQAPFCPRTCYLTLNPISRWIRLADPDSSGPWGAEGGSALFFLSGGEVRGARMTLEGQALMNELADYQPCTLCQWQQLSALAELGQLADLVQHLAQIGLVAWSAGSQDCREVA